MGICLEAIKEAHGEGGSFCNVNPSKENWINGFFGVSGFNISCIANFDCAKVDLYLGKAKKEENKKAFDMLMSHSRMILRRL